MKIEEKDWQRLCEMIGQETDTRRLCSLIEQLIQALDDRKQEHYSSDRLPAQSQVSPGADN